MNMKACRILSAVVAAFAAFVTFAETLVFAPGNGVTTNVTERLAAGVDVQANEGAGGGGIVNLMNAGNGAIGTATVKCGTLGFEDIARSSIGTLSLGNGTFRYRGAAPATANMKVVLDTAALDDAGVIWCDGDLKTIGTFDVNNGALIKAGPGSFTLATAARPDGQRQLLARSVAGRNWNWIMNMKANGDSPTQAYGNLTVREGHFVIDTAPDVDTVIGPAADSFNYSAYVLCGERSGATEPGSDQAEFPILYSSFPLSWLRLLSGPHHRLRLSLPNSVSNPLFFHPHWPLGNSRAGVQLGQLMICKRAWRTHSSPQA